MAVCWRCPKCRAISCEDDGNAVGKPLACDECELAILPGDTECPVCDAQNPWARRDSIHFWCRECGNMETFHSHLKGA